MRRLLNRAVLIGSLGCFVDSYDLVLFSTLRISSLQAIGVPSERIVDVGINLLNLQMLGMLLGGLMWGSLGDRRGRVSVLFGSIFLYSVATLSNGFVSSVWMYGILRFFAGLGLAGELGAAVTLVSEKMSPTERGWGTTLIAFMGAVGGLFAALTAEWFNWRTSYILGGLMGFALFGMRIRMSDSKLFETMRAKKVHRGNLLKIIFPRQRFFKVLTFVFIGLPIWYVVGILISFSPEIGA
ncbi:MAG: MFS transporter, partial [Bdellovibrio sp.]